MNILIVTQYFYPENFRINDLALELKKKGHTITVLTGKPNYPKGEYFAGYTFKGNDDEIWNDISIIRVPLRARKTGSINLLRNYISFAWNGEKRIKKLDDDFDIIYIFEVSPITVALPAITLKKKFNIPIIMNVQDLWPENIIAVTGINNKLIISCINKLVNYIYENCDLLLCSSPSFVDKIKIRLKDKNKVKYWPQYSLVSKYDGEKRMFNSNQFNIVFTGNIGEAQGIDIAIEAAKELKNTRIHWHFIGNGRSKDRLEQISNKYGLKDIVTFHGFKEEKEIPKYLASADAALLILKPNPIFEMTIPAKLQTYLACGVPIVGCVSGEAKKIIEKGKCGITTNSISKKELINVCRIMISLSGTEIEQFKENAYKYGNETFDKNMLINELIGFFKSEMRK